MSIPSISPLVLLKIPFFIHILVEAPAAASFCFWHHTQLPQWILDGHPDAHSILNNYAMLLWFTCAICLRQMGQPVFGQEMWIIAINLLNYHCWAMTRAIDRLSRGRSEVWRGVASCETERIPASSAIDMLYSANNMLILANNKLISANNDLISANNNLLAAREKQAADLAGESHSGDEKALPRVVLKEEEEKIQADLEKGGLVKDRAAGTGSEGRGPPGAETPSQPRRIVFGWPVVHLVAHLVCAVSFLVVIVVKWRC